jgi:type I restriction enzyme, S subunit
MGTFETRPLGEVLGTKGYIRGPFGSALVRRELLDSGIPVYEQQHAISNSREFRYYIDEAKFKELARFTVQPKDLIISCSGTVGRISMIENDDPIGIISQALLILRPDASAVLPKFLQYFLSTPTGQHELVQASHGSVQTNIAPRAVVERIPVPAPPIEEQRAIAVVLGAFDDKIELNRRMNATLEGLARALFKSWFVDFDPVRAKMAGRPTGLPAEIDALFPDGFEASALGEVPRGWEVQSLDEIATYLNGLALQKYPATDDEFLPVIKIAQMRKGKTDGADRASTNIPEDYIIQDGDVLFSWSGSLEVIIWTGGVGALNQHLFKVTSDSYPKWFYFMWTREHLPDFQFIAAGKATTMGHIQRKHLTDAKALVPNQELLEAMDEIIGPILDRIVTNDLESRTLAALRDALLPKLMSGEVRVRGSNNLTIEQSQEYAS